MTDWVCAKDGTPVAADRFDPWCPACQDDTLAVLATEPGPEPHPDPLKPWDYRAICGFFTSRGEVNRARRMRHLTRITGRVITDYWELTAAEGHQARAALKEWAHGIRT